MIILPQDVFVAWENNNHVRSRNLPINEADSRRFLLAAREQDKKVVALVTRAARKLSSVGTLGQYTFDVRLGVVPHGYHVPRGQSSADSHWGTYAHALEIRLAAQYFAPVPFQLSFIQLLDLQVKRIHGEETHVRRDAAHDDIRLRIFHTGPGAAQHGIMETYPINYTTQMLPILNTVYTAMKHEFFGEGPIE